MRTGKPKPVAPSTIRPGDTIQVTWRGNGLTWSVTGTVARFSGRNGATDVWGGRDGNSHMFAYSGERITAPRTGKVYLLSAATASTEGALFG